MEIRLYKNSDRVAWDAYVLSHPKSNLYHLSAWKAIIERTYGHEAYYLVGEEVENLHFPGPTKRTEDSPSSNHLGNSKMCHQRITPTNSKVIKGVLPLINLRHFLFHNSLISIPFFDLGGILADDEEAERALLFEAMKLAEDLKVNNIELRHIQPLSWLNESSKLPGGINTTAFHRAGKAQSLKCHPISHELSLPRAARSLLHWGAMSCFTRSHKVRMLLALPESSEMLMKSFKSKLRSQIKKAMKQGLQAKVGGLELLEDFYSVFAVNMRDLGSPVHSKNVMKSVLEELPDKSRIVIIYKEEQPLACSLIVGFKDTLENPWASALREYSRLGPNMLLYWTMLEYACNNGYAYFDFGRSSPNEGTYKFKEQWGAKSTPLHWHYISSNDQPIDEEASKKTKFKKAIQYWRKLPLPVTKMIGPMLRKHIGL